jgi:hypothetical protein
MFLLAVSLHYFAFIIIVFPHYFTLLRLRSTLTCLLDEAQGSIESGDAGCDN